MQNIKHCKISKTEKKNLFINKKHMSKDAIYTILTTGVMIVVWIYYTYAAYNNYNKDNIGYEKQISEIKSYSLNN